MALPRLTLLLFAAVAVLGFGVAWVAVRPVPAAMTEQEVRSIVDEAMAAAPAPITDQGVRDLIAAALAEREAARPQSHATVDAATINPMIEQYLLANPRILQRVSEALEAEIRTAEAEQAAPLSPGSTTVSSPIRPTSSSGPRATSLVEMFGYNCGCCPRPCRTSRP